MTIRLFHATAQATHHDTAVTYRAENKEQLTVTAAILHLQEITLVYVTFVSPNSHIDFKMRVI
jgi:hypothetical protein